MNDWSIFALASFVFSQLCEVSLGAVILVIENPFQRYFSDAFCNFFCYHLHLLYHLEISFFKKKTCAGYCKFVLMVDITQVFIYILKCEFAFLPLYYFDTGYQCFIVVRSSGDFVTCECKHSNKINQIMSKLLFICNTEL